MPKAPRTTRSSARIEASSASSKKTATTVTTTAEGSVGNQAEATFEPSTDGKNDQPVYFWKPTQGNGYLGQWYWTPFTHEGEKYVTAEMWMMVGKARLFGDEDIAREMLETTDPKRHKALGRQVRRFDAEVWDKNKRDIVTRGNYLKFTISEDAEKLRGMLLATGERELVEASPMDRIWGIGFAEKNAGKSRARWGKNLLGKCLEEVRAMLREEKDKVEGDVERGAEKDKNAAEE